MKKWLKFPLFVAFMLVPVHAAFACGPLASGASCDITNTGDKSVGFEILITGTPSASTINVTGCMPGGTCDPVQTYTSNIDTILAPTLTKPYATFHVTVSFTGGVAPRLTVNLRSIPVSSAQTPPAGPNASIQYNCVGAFCGNSQFVYDSVTGGFWIGPPQTSFTDSLGDGAIDGSLNTGVNKDVVTMLNDATNAVAFDVTYQTDVLPSSTDQMAAINGTVEDRRVAGGPGTIRIAGTAGNAYHTGLGSLHGVVGLSGYAVQTGVGAVDEMWGALGYASAGNFDAASTWGTVNYVQGNYGGGDISGTGHVLHAIAFEGDTFTKSGTPTIDDATSIHAKVQSVGTTNYGLRVDDFGTGYAIKVDGGKTVLGGTAAVSNGTTVLYRCTVAGTLRVGQLTSVAADCGTAVDTGLRTP